MEARAPRAGAAGTRTMGLARRRRRCARVKASRGGPGYPRAGRPRAEAAPDGAETIGDIPRPAWWSTVAYETDCCLVDRRFDADDDGPCARTTAGSWTTTPLRCCGCGRSIKWSGACRRPRWAPG